MSSFAIVSVEKESMEKESERISKLKAPTMALKGGHTKEVLSVAFNSEGNCLASAGADKHILLWNVYGDCENTLLIKGPSAAITDVAWNITQDSLFASSADNVIHLFDAEDGEWNASFVGHRGIVNSVFPTRRNPEMVASASDDKTIKFWDVRTARCVRTVNNSYPQTSVVVMEDGINCLYGGTDGVISMYDLRNESVLFNLTGHNDIISSLAISLDGTSLISNSMDNTLCLWDIKPFCLGSRCKRIYKGHTHNAEKRLMRCCWSKDGKYCAVGSSDGTTIIYNLSLPLGHSTNSSKSSFSNSSSKSDHSEQVSIPILGPWRILPGHKGCVNAVDWHPSEPVIATCSTDRSIIIGEVEL